MLVRRHHFQHRVCQGYSFVLDQLDIDTNVFGKLLAPKGKAQTLEGHRYLPFIELSFLRTLTPSLAMRAFPVRPMFRRLAVRTSLEVRLSTSSNSEPSLLCWWCHSLVFSHHHRTKIDLHYPCLSPQHLRVPCGKRFQAYFQDWPARRRNYRIILDLDHFGQKNGMLGCKHARAPYNL